MKILDRYIIRLFLMNFVILFFVIMSMFVLIDFISDMDVFLRAGNANAKANNSWVVWEVIKALFKYELPMIIVLYTFLSGLLINGAMGFTLSHLNRRRELVAIVSSGMSLYRLALPMLITAFLLLLINLPIQEFVLPNLASQLTSSKGEVLNQSEKKTPLRFAPDTKGNLFYAAKVIDDPQKGFYLKSPRIFEHDEQGKLKRVISASQATWDDQNKRWDLIDALATYPQRQNQSVGVKAQVEDIEYFETGLSPKLIRSMNDAKYARLLSIQDLNELPYTRALSKMQIKQLIHGRFSMIFINLFVFAIALSFFLTREPQDSRLQSIKASGLTLIIWGLGVGIVQVGIISGNPLASAWLPVVLLIPMTAYYWQAIKT